MEPFKLHTVLKYRKQLENRAMHAYFEALEEEAQALAVYRQHQEELEQLYTTLQSDRDQGTTVTRLILMENRITIVKEHLAQAEEQLSEAKKKLTMKKTALIEAGKDRRIIEKLEEKQNETYRRYLERKERIMLDELAVINKKS